MRTMFKALAATALVGVSAGANAAVIIDDFYNFAEYGSFAFGTVQAYKYPGSEQLVATASSSTGTILGGERDVRAEIVNPVGYTGDNDQASVAISNTRFGPYNQSLLNFGIGLGAEGLFRVTYDGLDNSPGNGPGLGFNAANAGNMISLQYFASLVLGDSTVVPVDVRVRLTDGAGQSSTVTQTMPANVYGSYSNTLDYLFSAFETANTQFDLTNISRIEVESQFRQASYLDGWISFSQFGIAGATYTPGNTPGGPAEVPEPAMLGLFGLAALGLASRRRAR